MNVLVVLLDIIVVRLVYHSPRVNVMKVTTALEAILILILNSLLVPLAITAAQAVVNQHHVLEEHTL